MGKIEEKREWSVAIRINHWAMAAAIVVLIVTGFYIADPFTVYQGETTYKMFMGEVRFWHLIFGIFLLFLVIWRIYLAFFSRFHADWKDFFVWINLKGLVNQVRFYLLIDKDEPERDERYLYGPTQSLTYLGLLAIILCMVATGLILMGAGYHAGLSGFAYKVLRPVENMLGGLAMVRYIHHILTWCFVLFIPVHVYMAFWHDALLKQGTVSSMISGVLFKRVEK
ncbi:MAG: Ni/Fe-hydrogenase, b-type cytochrome subunit [Syntrophobacterales bacterium]|nr:Ni/Fe-hydrogenase, b-type cytochrome subunit [Syntrophobacterales bacterium]